jgi:hypothetical protein
MGVLFNRSSVWVCDNFHIVAIVAKTEARSLVVFIKETIPSRIVGYLSTNQVAFEYFVVEGAHNCLFLSSDTWVDCEIVNWTAIRKSHCDDEQLEVPCKFYE